VISSPDATPARTGQTTDLTHVSRHHSARHKTFLRAVAAIATVSHVPVSIAAIGLFRRLGAPCSTPIGIAWAAMMAGLFVAVAVQSFPDRRRSSLAVALIEVPCCIESCAAFFSLFPSALATIAVIVYELVCRAPIRLPAEVCLGSYAVGLVLSAYGSLVRRRRVRVVRREVRLTTLDPRLDGLCIAHLSDLHIGTLTPKAWGIAWARAAIAHLPDFVFVTGDLITSGTDYLDDAVEVVHALRAPLGVFVSLGNHDHFGDVRALASKLARGGVRVLRNEGTVVEHRGARLWIAGVDDTWTSQADLARSLAGRPEGMTTLLLSHDPRLFASAACKSVDLVLSGHTHAGQLAIPFAIERLNLSRLTTPYSSGIYHRGRSILYVNPGLGTTGPPIRIGAAPEITLVVLRAASS
jgi:hypothetical protein